MAPGCSTDGDRQKGGGFDRTTSNGQPRLERRKRTGGPDGPPVYYATGGDGPGLAVIVHHDDAEREYAYDRGSKIGGLDKALDEAEAQGWTVISMRDDWSAIFPPQQ